MNPYEYCIAKAEDIGTTPIEVAMALGIETQEGREAMAWNPDSRSKTEWYNTVGRVPVGSTESKQAIRCYLQKGVIDIDECFILYRKVEADPESRLMIAKAMVENASVEILRSFVNYNRYRDTDVRNVTIRLLCWRD